MSPPLKLVRYSNGDYTMCCGTRVRKYYKGAPVRILEGVPETITIYNEKRLSASGQPSFGTKRNSSKLLLFLGTGSGPDLLDRFFDARVRIQINSVLGAVNPAAKFISEHFFTVVILNQGLSVVDLPEIRV
ncbi:hypothetical protein SAMN04487895_106196 [Paenibacillus sophorae]|uniref:Uncharacterized protein n=1 Tax=Paenibacillus sophorae TaxID=1333845 RepID=A0A1H8NEU8_9BACL|nr:hypothetical protein SAMN04487895_106196 [Paenibacillus sophorae]